jgi:hypothetical protein
MNVNTYRSRSKGTDRNIELVSLYIMYGTLKSAATCGFGYLKPPSFVLNKEAARFCDTLLHIYQNMRCHLLKNRHLYLHCREKFVM